MGRGDWPDVVRECREAIDFSLKGLLYAMGVDIPKFQDLGDLLLKNKSQMPAGLSVDWDKVLRIASALKESPGSPIVGGSDFMTFGESFDQSSAAPTEEEAASLLEDVRYLNDLGKKACELSCLQKKHYPR